MFHATGSGALLARREALRARRLRARSSTISANVNSGSVASKLAELRAGKSLPGLVKNDATAKQSQPAADPRMMMCRVERGAQAVASSALGSPPWICLAALFCSQYVGYFGDADLGRTLAAIAVVLAASLLVRVVFHHFNRLYRGAADVRIAQLWFTRVLLLDALLSTTWGLAAWLLWQPGNLANHLFLALISLSVVARFMVSRGGHMAFFVASFGPMATLLLVRFLVENATPELFVALLIPFYAIHVAFDVRRHSGRMDSDAELSFANEDLAHALEQARDEAQRKRLEAESANASKTTFLANMSHELRTPLNAILGFSEIIARECLGPVGSPRYKEYAGDIHSSGAHLLSLINELLDVAKIEAGKMEIEPNLIDTRPMLENTLKLIGIRARERNQTLSVHIAPDADLFYADERAFKQILINLASNAVKFTQEGGRIDVAARRNLKGEFELLVADNGPGIAREKLDLVFKPFAQIDNRYDRKAAGTGLGLALVQGLARLHGGRAWIESAPGRGTRAYVALPLTDEAAKAARVA